MKTKVCSKCGEEKNKGKEKYIVKSDSLIEIESRNAVKKIQIKKFYNL